MNYLKRFIKSLGSQRFMYIILNTLGMSIVIYILYATRYVWSDWLNLIITIIKPFFIGFAIAYGLSPLIAFLEEKKIKRNLAIAMVYILLISLFLLIICTLLPLLYSNSIELTNNFVNGVQEIEELVSNSLKIDASEYFNKLINTFDSYFHPDALFNTSLNVINQFLSFLANGVIYLVLSIYFLSDYKNVRAAIKKFSVYISPNTPIYLRRIDESLQDYIKAFVLLAFIQGVLYGTMYLLLGHPHWITLGLLSGISGILPYIGPIISNMFGFVTMLGFGTFRVVALLLSITFLSNLDAYFITPKLYSKKIAIKAIWVLFGILSGSTLFGPIGIVISVPCLIIIKNTIHTYKVINKKTTPGQN